MPIACHSCKGETVQKLSLVYEGGVSKMNGKQHGVGVGMGRGGLGLGVGSSKITGTQQTALSKKAAPPAKKRTIKLLGIYFLLFFIFVSFVFSAFRNLAAVATILIIGYLVIAAVHFYKNLMFNKTQFPAMFQTWDRQFMCNTCGTVFTPDLN